MSARSNIKKGKELENYVADQIKVIIGTDARRSIGSGSGTREKADIDTSLTVLGRNVGIECKNHKTLLIQKWWRQTVKLEVLGREPILVYKESRESFGETKAVIRLDTLLRLAKRAKEPNTVEEPNREIQYALKTLIQAAKKVLKHLER